MIALLLGAQTTGAILGFAHTDNTQPAQSMIAYQGRLADANGSPLTGTYNMIFRLYDAASGGVPLWEEQWTGSNGVAVSDGLFNVMLGSLTAIPQSVITGNGTLWLGITVGTDDEMKPRVQLGSVPFAVQALTVPDGSVTTAKIANGAVTQAKAPTLAWAKSHGSEGVKIEVFTVTCFSTGGCDYWFTAGFSETPTIFQSSFDHLDISDYGPNPTNSEALHAVSQANSTHTLMAIGR